MSDLADLGLSSYEEKAYRSLLSLGPATAREVSEAGDVPRGRVYDVLNGLDARGIVRTREGEPTTYAPVDPEVAADRLLSARERDIEAERQRYEDAAAGVKSSLAGPVPTEGRFWSVPAGSKTARSILEAQFAAADERILSVVGPPYDRLDWTDHRAELSAMTDLLEGDLDLRWILTEDLVEAVPDAAWDELPAGPGSPEVRSATEVFASFDVIDREAVYVTVPAPFAADDVLGGVVVRDAELVERLETRFERFWERAAPVR
jgi:sugar-specific transcriptional regulator TrmB